ncbi:MAG: hypothetical protein QOD91_114 [Frankiales bacterium]|nr:hypothetical protein [Frankiales bacterium]
MTTPWPRRRRQSLRTKIAVGVLAAGVLPFAIGVGLTIRQAQSDIGKQAKATADERATSASVQLAGVFHEQHFRLLLAADNEVFDRWYAEPASRPAMRATVDAALVRVFELDSALTDEACFIDATGPEQARMVEGVSAPVATLSPNESANPFFKPTFALSAGAVYQGSPYISPDSHRWVFPNATPILRNGKAVALLHFETSIEGMRQLLAKSLGSGMRGRIIDTSRNLVIADTGSKVPIAGQAFAAYTALHLSNAQTSVRPVEAVEGDLNHWSVEVSVVPQGPGAWRDLPWLLGLVAVTILVLSIAAVRFSSSIARRLRRVGVALEAAGEGDLTTEIPPDGEDEIGAMAKGASGALLRMRTTLAVMSEHADSLQGAADELTTASEQTHAQAAGSASLAGEVSVAGRQIGTSVAVAATGVAQMADSMREIAVTTADAATVCASAAELAGTMSVSMEQLQHSSLGVAEIVEMIGTIAEQTNLLALNATIEAARAGDAGRGFAVVAAEVKDLSRQTGEATRRAAELLAAIESGTTAAVDVAGEIGTVLDEISRHQQTISAAVEENTVVGAEVARGVTQAAAGSGQIALSIGTVATAAQETTAVAVTTRESAERLSAMSETLRALVGEFRI